MALITPTGKPICTTQNGFTYMGLLMIIAIAGIGMAGVGIIWHQESQREREKELLFIGEEYRKAIGSYYENSPSGLKQFPDTLIDLVLDNRFPNAKRHIRQLYADPVAMQKDWNLVLQQGKVIGLHSTSDKQPIKKTGFAPQYETFGEAASYKDWLFVYTPGSIVVSAPAAPVVNAPVSDTLNSNLGLSNPASSKPDLSKPDLNSPAGESASNQPTAIEPASNSPLSSLPETKSPFSASPFSTLPNASEPAP